MTLALGSRSKQGLAKVNPKMKPETHISCFQDCKKVWGMNPHTTKWALTLGVGIPMDSRIFKKQLKGQNSLN
jgi:hypothetical protein